MSKFQHQIEEVSLIQAPVVWIPYYLVMPPPHENDENALELQLLKNYNFFFLFNHLLRYKLIFVKKSAFF